MSDRNRKTVERRELKNRIRSGQKVGDYDPKTKTERYIILFKLKDVRPNRTDDKFEILRKAIGGNPAGYDGTEQNYVVQTNLKPNDKKDRTPGPGRPQHKYNNGDKFNPTTPHKNAVRDFNSFRYPTLVCNLTKDQYDKIRKDPNVHSITPNYMATHTAQQEGYQFTTHKIKLGWDTGMRKRGEGVMVQASDTGLDFAHEDLPFSGYTDYIGIGHSFVEDEPDLQDITYVDYQETQEYPHGTAVLGIMVAQDNDLGMVGVAPAARGYIAKMESKDPDHRTGGVTFEIMMSTLVWAESFPTNVLNLSYGGVGYNEAFDRISLEAYVDYHMLMCASAGNTMALYGGTFTREDEWSVPPGTVTPAGLKGFIEVSASQEDNVPTTNQNTGYWGTSYSKKTEFIAPGWHVLSTMPQNHYENFSGTSCASPVTAGCFCCLYANLKRDYCGELYSFRGNAPDILRIAARKTAWKKGMFSGRDPNNVYGWGFVDVQAAAQEISTTQALKLATMIPEDVLGIYGTDEMLRD